MSGTWYLTGVHFTSPNEGWAVGEDWQSPQGVLLKYTSTPPDTTPPDTQIGSGPSGTITHNNPSFTYTGSDNVTPSADLVYATYLQGYDSGWSSFSSSTTKSYSNLPNGSYTFQIKAKDQTGNEDPTPATRSFTVNYTNSITLQSPTNGATFDSCFLITNHQPPFEWTVTVTLTKYTILFAPSQTDFTDPIARASISGPRNSWIPSVGTWKKIMTSSYNGGNIQDIYWKIIGTKSDKTTEESEVRSFRIATPQAKALQSPANHAVLPSGTPPTFDFGTNCNVKFKLEFSSLNDFSDPKKIKGFNYSTKDPNAETALHKTLTGSQWTAVKKLVGTRTGYFKIKAWDGLNRETVSETRMFFVQ